MVKYEFNYAEEPVVSKSHPKYYLCEKVLSIMSMPMDSVRCPVHGEGAFATVKMDVTRTPFDWELDDVCCESFREEVEAAMPFPWTGTPHHLQP